MNTSDQGAFVDTALARFVALRLAGCETCTLEQVAANAGLDTLDQLMCIAHGETSVAFEQVPQLAAALRVSASFVTGLAAEEHWSNGFLNIFAAALPAVSGSGIASIATAMSRSTTLNLLILPSQLHRASISRVLLSTRANT